jgi:PTS system galactitol-specific IIA component
MGVIENTKIPLEEENILLLYEPKDSGEVIKRLSWLLEKKGYVKSSFFDAVLKRELSLPTGLELEGDVNAAIPHADVEHVNVPSVALAVLGKPVTFRCMVEPEKDLPVQLVFLLAMNEPKKQIELLQHVASILQDNELVNRLVKSRSEKEVMDALNAKMAQNHLS